jgi:hypothetical protein
MLRALAAVGEGGLVAAHRRVPLVRRACVGGGVSLRGHASGGDGSARVREALALAYRVVPRIRDRRRAVGDDVIGSGHWSCSFQSS